LRAEKPLVSLEPHLPHDRANAKAVWAQKGRAAPVIKMAHSTMGVKVKRSDIVMMQFDMPKISDMKDGAFKELKAVADKIIKKMTNGAASCATLPFLFMLAISSDLALGLKVSSSKFRPTRRRPLRSA
jgi:hypothetical protein